MRAILIDPFNRTVTEENLKDGSYDSLKAAVFSGDPSAAKYSNYLEHISLGAGHGAYLDEEGLLRPWSEQAFFKFGPERTLAGRALVVRDTSDGDVAAARLPLELVAQQVQWITPQEVRVPAPIVNSLPKDWNPGDPIPAPDIKEWWTFDNQPT